VPGRFGRRERGTMSCYRVVGVLDGAQPGGDPGLAGGDGLAVAPTIGAFGQAGAESFDLADVTSRSPACAARAHMAMLAVVASRFRLTVQSGGQAGQGGDPRAIGLRP